MQSIKAPIGYWVKEVDVLLTKGINEAQAIFGLTRTGWQVLLLIFEKEQINKDELINPHKIGRLVACPKTIILC